MSTLLAIANDLKGYIIGGVGIAVALFVGWFSTKKIATVQTQAKADVATAQEQAKSAETVAEQQNKTTEAVKNVQETNASLSDDAARKRMQSSRYNSPD